jgi:hypothetical protein
VRSMTRLVDPAEALALATFVPVNLPLHLLLG